MEDEFKFYKFDDDLVESISRGYEDMGVIERDLYSDYIGDIVCICTPDLEDHFLKQDH